MCNKRCRFGACAGKRRCAQDYRSSNRNGFINRKSRRTNKQTLVCAADGNMEENTGASLQRAVKEIGSMNQEMGQKLKDR